jgi:nitrilase
MAKTFRVAALQMCSSENVANNLITAQQLLAEAKAQGAALAVLPENFALMGLEENDKLAIAENFGDGPIQKFLSDSAHQHNMWIVAGTIPLRTKEANKVYAACLMFDPQGKCVARYDKIHLFDVKVPNSNYSYQESAFIAAGSDVVTLATPLANIGLSICYDLRFPELYRSQSAKGCELLCIPSAFTEKTGRAHWEILLRARAIENFSFIVASNQTGTHSNGRKTFGHSMIIDPWGTIIAEIKEGIGVITAEVDLNFLESVRAEFPSIKHRRL